MVVVRGEEKMIDVFSKSICAKGNQTAASRDGNRVVDSIFYDNNRYAKNASVIIDIFH